jgi:hypothetical protein
MIRPVSPPTASRCGRPAIAHSGLRESSWLCLYHVSRLIPASPQAHPCGGRYVASIGRPDPADAPARLLRRLRDGNESGRQPLLHQRRASASGATWRRLRPLADLAVGSIGSKSRGAQEMLTLVAGAFPRASSRCDLGWSPPSEAGRGVAGGNRHRNGRNS